MPFSTRARSATIFVFVWAVSACTTDRVETEFGALDTALSDVAQTISPELNRQIAAETEEAVRVSAQAGDLWILSDACRLVLDLDPDASLGSCQIITEPVGDREQFIGQATAADRKLGVLQAYVASLDALMDAQLDNEINTASASALAAFSEFADASGAKGLAAFLAKRKANKPKSDAVVSKAVEALRFNRMRKVVLDSDSSVTELCRDLQLHLINLEVDGGFTDISDRLRQARDDVLLTDRNDPVTYLNAINRLRSAHDDFETAYPKTTIFKVGLVAKVHSDLAKSLRSSGSNEDIIEYVKSLKTLLETVRS